MDVNNYDSEYSNSLIKEYEMYDMNIHYFDDSNVTYLDLIGQGQYSKVFTCQFPNGTIAAAKKLIPTEKWRLNREIKILINASTCQNILKLYGVYGDEDYPIIITSYFPQGASKIRDIDDLKWFTKELFLTLSCLHSKGIFHRDIKWQNLLVSFENKHLEIIDWGLSGFYRINHKYSPHVGTKSYEPPELLLEYQYYSTKVDIWAAGVVFLNLLFQCPSFFSAHDKIGVLQKEANIFGSKRIEEYSKSLDIECPFLLESEKISFLEFALPHSRHLITFESLDLLKKILIIEEQDRPSADVVLQHSFLL